MHCCVKEYTLLAQQVTLFALGMYCCVLLSINVAVLLNLLLDRIALVLLKSNFSFSDFITIAPTSSRFAKEIRYDGNTNIA